MTTKTHTVVREARVLVGVHGAVSMAGWQEIARRISQTPGVTTAYDPYSLTFIEWATDPEVEAPDGKS